MKLSTTLALFALLVAGCDSEPTEELSVSPATLSFQGVRVMAGDQTTMSLEGDRLHVAPDRSDEARSRRRLSLFVPGDLRQGDMEFDPGHVSEGASVVSTIISAGEEVASLRVTKRNGRTNLSVDYPSSLGVSAVRVVYRRAGQAVLTISSLPLQDERARQVSGDVGAGDGDPESVHVRRVSGRYIIVSDSEGTDNARQSCDGFALIPPGAYGSEFPNGICTDWVEVEPLDGDFPPSIDGFRVITEGLDGLSIHTLRASS